MALPDFSSADTRRGWLITAGLVIATLIVLRLAWRLLLPPSLPALTVTRQPLVQTVVATGRVRADSRARLGVQVNGVVERVLVREGDTVAAGTLTSRSSAATSRPARARRR